MPSDDPGASRSPSAQKESRDKHRDEKSSRHRRRDTSKDRHSSHTQRRRSSRSRSRSPRRHRDRSRDRDREHKHRSSTIRRSRSRSTSRSRRHTSSTKDKQRSRRDKDGYDYDAERAHARDTKERRSRALEDTTGRDKDAMVEQHTGRSARPLPSQESSWAVTRGEEPPVEKEKPNYGTTGVLAAESNSVKKSDGTMIRLKYVEPQDGCRPSKKQAWRLFVFRGKDVVDTVPISDRSMWLMGRERAVVDYPVEHGSVSGQHAVLQFRKKESRNEFGDREETVKLYVIDLESGNGTKLNGEKIPPSRYVELRASDVVKLGKSSTEYVVMLG